MNNLIKNFCVEGLQKLIDSKNLFKTLGERGRYICFTCNNQQFSTESYIVCYVDMYINESVMLNWFSDLDALKCDSCAKKYAMAIPVSDIVGKYEEIEALIVLRQ